MCQCIYKILRYIFENFVGRFSRYNYLLRAVESGDMLPVAVRFSVPSRPARGPPSLLYHGYRVFPGGKAAGAWSLTPTSI